MMLRGCDIALKNQMFIYYAMLTIQVFSLNLLHEKTMTLEVKHVLGLIKKKKKN